jgi:hypothetical protein
MPMKQAIYTLEMGVIKRSASVILKRTSVTSTRKDVYTQSVISTRIVILTRTNVNTTLTTVISTRTRVISTRRVSFGHVEV